MVSDRIKWDNKYDQIPELLEPRPPARMLVKHIQNTEDEKRALDVACGSGRHAFFLAKKGYCVDAIDISEIAVRTLQKRLTPDRCIYPKQADLDDYAPPEGHYDLIVMTNYLDRALIARLVPSLKKSGLFFVETYMKDPDNEKKQSNPDYLLEENELKQIFSEGFDIIEYDTFWNESFERYKMRKQAILVQKQ